MIVGDLCRIAVLSFAPTLLAACGGASENVSPGSVVVEVAVQAPPAPEPEPEPQPEPRDGSTVATVIPAHLKSAIADSGTTADSGFGGTVNAKHVVLTGNADDSLDWTDGWTGRIQYLYIEQTDSADNVIPARCSISSSVRPSTTALPSAPTRAARH